MTSPFKELTTSVALGVIKGIILVYDLITLPIYFLLQRPWTKTSDDDEGPQAKREVSNDRGSPLVPTDRPLMSDSFVTDCLTLDDLMTKVFLSRGDLKCLGSRDVLMVEDIKNPDGSSHATKKVQSPDYKWLTFAQSDLRIDQITRGLMSIGVMAGDKIAIIMQGGLDCLLTVHAVMRIGATSVIIHPKMPVAKVKTIISETEAHLLVVSPRTSVYSMVRDEEKATSDWPSVKNIIVSEDSDKGMVNPVMDKASDKPSIVKTFTQVEVEGSRHPPSTGMVKSPHDVVMIVYEEDLTDGQLKGIIITHKNIVSSIHSLESTIGSDLKSVKAPFCVFEPPTDMSSFILNHVLLMNGIPIAFGSPDTLTSRSEAVKDGADGDLDLIRPKLVHGDPRTFDQFRAGIMASSSVGSKSDLSYRFFDFCLDYSNYWRRRGFNSTIMNWLIFRKVKKTIGNRLNQVVVSSGKVTISDKTQFFLQSTLTADVITGLSVTEATGLSTLRRKEDIFSATNSIGYPMAGQKIKLVDYAAGGFFTYDHPSPRGEILVGGPTVSTGYFNNQSLTDQQFIITSDDTRWFKTGLIGSVCPISGRLSIIDRKENLIKLEFGTDFISLGQTEAVLRSSPFVDTICLYADSANNFILAFISPNRSTIETLCQSLDIEEGSLSFKEMCSDPEVQAEVTRAVVDHGIKSGLPKTLLPSKVKLCHDPWTPESGLVTADGHPIRREVARKYQMDINRMFGNVDHNRNVATRRHTPPTPTTQTTVVHMETREGIEMTETR